MISCLKKTFAALALAAFASLPFAALADSDEGKVVVAEKKLISVTAHTVSLDVYEKDTVSLSVSYTADYSSQVEWYYRKNAASKWVKAGKGKLDRTLANYLEIKNVSLNQNGWEYKFEITCRNETYTSDPIPLSVQKPSPIDHAVYVYQGVKSMETGTAYFNISGISYDAGQVLTYLWEVKKPGKNWAKIGKNSDELEIKDVKHEMADWLIRCKVRNNAMPKGKYAVSNEMDFVVYQLEPIDWVDSPLYRVAVTSEETASFSVYVSGELGKITYQWEIKKPETDTWAKIGKNSDMLEIKKPALALNGSKIRLKVRNAAMAKDEWTISDEAPLRVLPATKITSQPKPATVYEGGDARFSVAADNGGDLAYQWQFSYDGGKNWSNISGAKSADLDLLSVELPYAKESLKYRCATYGIMGSGFKYSSAAGLTVRERAKIGKFSAIQGTYEYVFPAISWTAEKLSVDDDYPLTLKVEASGYKLKYQWYENLADGTKPIKGATSSTYKISKLKDSDDGRQIYCTVSNSGENAEDSTVAELYLEDSDMPKDIMGQQIHLRLRENQGTADETSSDLCVYATGSTSAFMYIHGLTDKIKYDCENVSYSYKRTSPYDATFKLNFTKIEIKNGEIVKTKFKYSGDIYFDSSERPVYEAYESLSGTSSVMDIYADFDAVEPWSNINVSGITISLEAISPEAPFGGKYMYIETNYQGKPAIAKITDDFDGWTYSGTIIPLTSFVYKKQSDCLASLTFSFEYEGELVKITKSEITNFDEDGNATYRIEASIGKTKYVYMGPIHIEDI